MQYLKLLFLLALVILFVGTSFSAIFGGGKVLTSLFKAYVFKVETCQYDYRAKPIPVEVGGEILAEEPTEECKIDYNDAKRDISEGLAMVIVATPIAFLLFRKIKEHLKTEEV